MAKGESWVEKTLREALKKEAVRQPVKGGKDRIDKATGNDKGSKRGK